MTKKVFETPKIWLDLELCKTFYNRAPRSLSLDQPLSHFSDRFKDRLESILGSINSSFGGVLLYPQIIDCAAGYLVKLNCGHPFSNGNKRLSVYYTDLFLFLNGIDWVLSPEDAYVVAIRIANAYDKGKKESEIIEELKPYLLQTCNDAFIDEYITKTR